MIKDLDMLLPLFTFVAALFGSTNRACESVDHGLPFGDQNRALKNSAGLFLTESFYFWGNCLLCLPAHHELNPVGKCWRKGATRNASSDSHSPEKRLNICFTTVIFNFMPRNIKNFMLEAAPRIRR
jgi:hypothetical protein